MRIAQYRHPRPPLDCPHHPSSTSRLLSSCDVLPSVRLNTARPHPGARKGIPQTTKATKEPRLGGRLRAGTRAKQVHCSRSQGQPRDQNNDQTNALQTQRACSGEHGHTQLFFGNRFCMVDKTLARNVGRQYRHICTCMSGAEGDGRSATRKTPRQGRGKGHPGRKASIQSMMRGLTHKAHPALPAKEEEVAIRAAGASKERKRKRVQ